MYSKADYVGVTFWSQFINLYLNSCKIYIYEFILKLHFKCRPKALKNSGVIICMNFPKENAFVFSK